jgi:hypothetical protein
MASFGEEQEACPVIRVDNKPFDVYDDSATSFEQHVPQDEM